MYLAVCLLPIFLQIKNDSVIIIKKCSTIISKYFNFLSKSTFLLCFPSTLPITADVQLVKEHIVNICLVTKIVVHYFTIMTHLYTIYCLFIYCWFVSVSIHHDTSLLCLNV